MVNELSFPELGTRVRAARAKAGVTRKQLASASGTSERYIANIESGTGNPSLGVLHGLAKALGVAIAELLPLGGERGLAHMEAAAMVRRLSGKDLTAAVEWLGKSRPVDLQKARRIVLIGLRGAGKTSLGAALSEHLGMPFVEMSREVERAYGGEMRLLIEIGGQGALRRYEHEAWESILDNYEAAVIATPGGIVADSMLFDRMLATAHSVWLEADPADHMARVMAQGDFRPMASNCNAMEDLKNILNARSADYARADWRLNTSTQSFAETLARLKSTIGDL